jgi:hypothetical protein
MTFIPQNRMADTEKRGQGRPPKSEPRMPTVPLVPNPEVEPQLTVTAQRHPPCCGRAQNRQPRIERWRTIQDGVRVADCICPNCGKRYVETPAQARAK